MICWKMLKPWRTPRDIAIMTAPGYFDYSQEEIKNIFLRFIDQSPLPVLVYDIPDFTGVKLDEGLISDLVQHENVVGIRTPAVIETLFIPVGSL
ncbi:MAG: dihydrodipicolinate synthase family protein [[Clostridium] leptum]